MYAGKKVILVGAFNPSGVFGLNGKLPWHSSSDLKHFKRVTEGSSMIMGRKTAQSLPGILPGREHVVITSNQVFDLKGMIMTYSFSEALENCSRDTICIIGGGSVWRQALDSQVVDEARVTVIDVHVPLEQDPEVFRANWADHKLCLAQPVEPEFLEVNLGGAVREVKHEFMYYTRRT